VHFFAPQCTVDAYLGNRQGNPEIGKLQTVGLHVSYWTEGWGQS